MNSIATRPDPTTVINLPRPGEWSITWRGSTLHESELTGQHLAVLSLITGSDSYEDLDIDPRDGHQRLMMMLSAVAAVAATEGLDENADADAVAHIVAEAMMSVTKASVDEILGSLNFG